MRLDWEAAVAYMPGAHPNRTFQHKIIVGLWLSSSREITKPTPPKVLQPKTWANGMRTVTGVLKAPRTCIRTQMSTIHPGRGIRLPGGCREAELGAGSFYRQDGPRNSWELMGAHGSSWELMGTNSLASNSLALSRLGVRAWVFPGSGSASGMNRMNTVLRDVC